MAEPRAKVFTNKHARAGVVWGPSGHAMGRQSGRRGGGAVGDALQAGLGQQEPPRRLNLILSI